ncbi:MAG TPA: protease modulator HflC [Bryobacterales bacterium]|nr:protease modulator HflC [Bryobacterales bacterium]
MNGTRTALLVLLAAIVLAVWSATYVVDEREQIVIVRFGKIQKVVHEPGLYFKVPVLDELVRIDDRILFFDTPDKAVQVVDGRRYLVDAITVLRITDPRLFIERVGGSLARAQSRLEPRIEAALRAVYGRRTFDAALSKDRVAMMGEIAEMVRPEARDLGIEIVDVRIRRTDLLPEVLEATYKRMKEERFAEAAQLRAVGRAKAARIRAEADRRKVEMIANAQKEAEIIRGGGDAERNRIFAEAFGKDRDFFAFYRSMQAYAKSLTEGTTLVVRPSSEFFRYFDNSSEAPLKGRAADSARNAQ